MRGSLALTLQTRMNEPINEASVGRGVSHLPRVAHLPSRDPGDRSGIVRFCRVVRGRMRTAIGALEVLHLANEVIHEPHGYR
jgi:hypothetical protein